MSGGFSFQLAFAIPQLTILCNLYIQLIHEISDIYVLRIDINTK